MNRNTQVISSVSRKARLNIATIVFILFIIICVIVCVNPIVTMINKKNEIFSLESKLNTVRKENIDLLALEKSLYNDDAIAQEALKQFNSASAGDRIVYSVNEIDRLKRETTSNSFQAGEEAVYSNNNLWENLKILYYKEIYKADN